MSKQAVKTPHAPAAIGAYSQAVVSNGVVYCSGQIALDPGTGQVIEGDVVAQTERVMENLSEVLQAAGSSFAGALRCTIFLADMADFAAVNEVYARYFEGSVPPSRACVAVRSLPRGVDVEIDCIAEAKG
jgi:2-iminobutanoate/2-iminopropanoate deaminase